MAINVTFPVGVTCAPFDIPIIDDTLSEGNETFDIVILEDSLPFGVVFDDADKSTTVTIIENDCKYIVLKILNQGHTLG